jgi:hypothetical protein
MSRSPDPDSILSQDLSELIAGGQDVGMAPPPDTDEPMISKSLRIPLSLDEALSAAAAEREMRPSALARQILEAGVVALTAEQVMVPLADVQRLLLTLARPVDPERRTRHSAA